MNSCATNSDVIRNLLVVPANEMATLRVWCARQFDRTIVWPLPFPSSHYKITWDKRTHARTSSIDNPVRCNRRETQKFRKFNTKSTRRQLALNTFVRMNELSEKTMEKNV